MTAFDLRRGTTSVIRELVEKCWRGAWRPRSAKFSFGIVPAHYRSGAMPTRMQSHISIAAVALVTHAGAFWSLEELCGLSSGAAQLAAGIATCIATYGVQEWLSYQRRGPWRWYLGILPFLVSCSIGLAADTLMALSLARSGFGSFSAMLGGAAVLVWWNYGAVQRHSGFGQ